METYFVITNSDGDTSIDKLTSEELKTRLDAEYYGNRVKFLDVLPDHDPNYWGEDSVLIIKGEIFTPKLDRDVA